MTNILIKLGKAKKTFPWDELITSQCTKLEIIAQGLEFIDNRLEELTELKALIIHCPELKELPPSISELKKLEILKIKNNKKIQIPNEGNYPNLKTLQLANIGLTAIPTWITRSTSLEVLDLHANSLTDLPDSIIKLQNLLRMNLDSNEFTTLPWEIEELKKLNHLSLDGNKFSADEKLRIERVLNIKF